MNILQSIFTDYYELHPRPAVIENVNKMIHCGDPSYGGAMYGCPHSPKSKEYPYMIEIFSRNPDFIILEDDAVLTPLPIDDEISSLSAILLNEAYYELLKTGQMMVDSKNIKKHKNDVFRLAQLITANTRQVLSPEIAEDMKKFLSEIADETVDLKSLGIRGTDKKKMTDMLYQCYGLKDNT